MRGNLFVISAPSGTGKTSLVRALRERLPDIEFSVSYTTRKERKGEVQGKDYHFVTHQTFSMLRENGAFAEWAEVHGEFYGTRKTSVQEKLDRGTDVILDIDYQGARQIRQSTLGAVTIFIRPPSIEELEKRLRSRGTDSEETIQRRLAKAPEEIGCESEFDDVIVNDDFDRALVELVELVSSYRHMTSFG